MPGSLQLLLRVASELDAPAQQPNPQIFQQIVQRDVRLRSPRFQRESICQILRQFRVGNEFLQDRVAFFRFKALNAVTKISAVASATLTPSIVAEVPLPHNRKRDRLGPGAVKDDASFAIASARR